MPTLDLDALHEEALQEDEAREADCPEPTIVLSIQPAQAQALHELLSEARIPNPQGKVLLGSFHIALIQAVEQFQGGTVVQ